jgi:glutathione S-transferase
MTGQRLLYHTSFSPACRKIRCMMDEMELEFKLMEEPVWQQREEFMKINPSGEIPVLVDGNGLVLCGSYAVTEYLEEGYRVHSLLGDSLQLRAEVRRLIHWVDYKLLREVTQPLLHEKFFRQLLKAGQPDTVVIRRAKRMMEQHLEVFEALLSKQEWLAGDRFTLADISAAAHISLYDYLSDVNWKRGAPLTKWYALIKSRPSFRRVLKDRVRGVKPPEHYENPDF